MSWAWRSFLGRPQHLVLSSLQPARRHGSQKLTAVLGNNKLIGIRSRGCTSNTNSSNEVKDAMAKRHLYVVLDDHKDGFRIHKLDLGDHNDDDSLDGGARRRFQDPPFLRVAFTTLGDSAQFAAVGSSIVAIGTITRGPGLDDCYVGYLGGVLIYDTKTAELTVTAHLPTGLERGRGYRAALAIGNSLYMLGSVPPWSDCHGGGSLHCLTADPVNADGDEFWGWRSLSDSSPWCWSHYGDPPPVPFRANDITAHAVHASPPGAAAQQHEILVSVRPTETSLFGATYSFSTPSSEWTLRGEWQLPIVGHAHYDGELDAWVGLHAANDDDGNIYGPNAHLCVGNITSLPTEWKVGREKLFPLDEDTDAGWRHVDAKLVPDGGAITEYCLMERLQPVGAKGNVKECLVRLTTFRVELGEDGEPVATARRPARSYSVSRHIEDFEAQAFWM